MISVLLLLPLLGLAVAKHPANINITKYEECIDRLGVPAILSQHGKNFRQYANKTGKANKNGYVPGLHKCLGDSILGNMSCYETAPLEQYNYLEDGPDNDIYVSSTIDINAMRAVGFDLDVDTSGDEDDNEDQLDLGREYDQNNTPESVNRELTINLFKKKKDPSKEDCNGKTKSDYTCGKTTLTDICNTTLTDICNSINGNPSEQLFIHNRNDFEINFRAWMHHKCSKQGGQASSGEHEGREGTWPAWYNQCQDFDGDYKKKIGSFYVVNKEQDIPLGADRNYFDNNKNFCQSGHIMA